MATITFYNVVLFVHITAVVIAFGGTFTYPLWFAVVGRTNPRAVPAMLHLQGEIGKKIITPAGTVILLAGIYLAAKGPYDFSDAFVSIGIALIVILLGMGGAFFSPQERRLEELGERDVAAAGDGPVEFSAEFQALAGRIAKVGALANVMVLAAIFVMAVKLGV